MATFNQPRQAFFEYDNIYKSTVDIIHGTFASGSVGEHLMAKITPDGIGKIYGGDARAVGDLNLEIEDGEFLIQIYATEPPTANCARSQKHAD